MSWLPLVAVNNIDSIIADSHHSAVVILKHSTRCSISVMALGRLDRSDFPHGIPFYLLDLLQHRDLSNELSLKFGIHHESPQILIIKNGICIYDESHQGIRMEDIIEAIG